jgi:hypothetical protein
MLDRALDSPRPDLAVRQTLDYLERRATDAERSQAGEEEILARAVDAMQRTASARRAAQRAVAEADRIEDERRRERRRLRKNARARARYGERRLTEPPRPNKRTGMHALAIEVDPSAYQAVKLEALQRHTAIPQLIGDILRSRASTSDECLPTSGPRWRRTGQGRRANQHTRVDIDDETWENVHVEALQAGFTVSRWVGRLVEYWVASRRHDELR